MGLFSGKTGLIMGVANDRSIAWAISEALYAEGAELAFTHLPSPSNQRRVHDLVDARSPRVVVPCDVQRDEDILAVVAAVKEAYGRLDFPSTRSPSPRRRSCGSPTCKPAGRAGIWQWTSASTASWRCAGRPRR